MKGEINMQNDIGGHDPKLILLAGIIFYSIAIFGAWAGQLIPKHEQRVIVFILECFPALIICHAACVLRIPVVIAILLALT